MATDRTFPYPIFQAPGLLGPVDRRGARFTLDPALSHTGMFDGAWWPRSRELARELPALIMALRRRVGPILHVGVERTAWNTVPDRITVDGRVVRVNCFSSSVHTIGVGGGHQDRFLLLVVPPRTRPTVARTAMAAAAAPGNSTLAARILTAASWPGRPRSPAAAGATPPRAGRPRGRRRGRSRCRLGRSRCRRCRNRAADRRAGPGERPGASAQRPGPAPSVPRRSTATSAASSRGAHAACASRSRRSCASSAAGCSPVQRPIRSSRG